MVGAGMALFLPWRGCDGAVLIEDGRVRWAGRTGDSPTTTAATRRIDVRGDTILPGFIDCHVHMA
ncbi:hypothetical protein EAO72_40760, partial [Streptomyces sp. or43]